jgi:hypothetical protein
MDKPSFVYTTFIKTTPERLWQRVVEHARGPDTPCEADLTCSHLTA